MWISFQNILANNFHWKEHNVTDECNAVCAKISSFSYILKCFNKWWKSVLYNNYTEKYQQSGLNEYLSTYNLRLLWNFYILTLKERRKSQKKKNISEQIQEFARTSQFDAEAKIHFSTIKKNWKDQKIIGKQFQQSRKYWFYFRVKPRMVIMLNAPMMFNRGRKKQKLCSTTVND